MDVLLWLGGLILMFVVGGIAGWKRKGQKQAKEKESIKKVKKEVESELDKMDRTDIDRINNQWMRD